MGAYKVNSLLLIAFNAEAERSFKEELTPFCNIKACYTTAELENLNISLGAIIYLMDFTSSNHLRSITFIRDKYPDKPFFIISSTLSIPLLHHALHLAIDDLFLYPLSIQDKHFLFLALKKQGCIDSLSDESINKYKVSSAHINKIAPISFLLDIIERDYVKGPSLQDLANDIHLSPSRICHLFKDICGITYSYYLLCRKIEEGERLLMVGQSSITSIAYQIGFANPSHFCRSFKTHFNITPTSYANGNREIYPSLTYLKYLRLRSEFLFDLSIKREKSNRSLLGKPYVS